MLMEKNIRKLLTCRELISNVNSKMPTPLREEMIVLRVHGAQASLALFIIGCTLL
jgi:hypothetical protein